MKKFIILGLLCFAPMAHAVCTGLGTAAISCPAGESAANITSAISGAPNNAVVTFANGAYTFGGGQTILLLSTKGVTLICASVGGCTITQNGTGSATIAMSSMTVGNSFLYRISGFVFNRDGGQFAIWWCSGGNCTGTLSQVRIDHNTFNLGATNEGVSIFFGENNSVTNYYGVVDHNTVNCGISCQLAELDGKTNPSPPAPPLGQSSNMFMEDNTITITNMSNAGRGCIDGWSSLFAVVARHNTSTNCLWTSHGVTHGGGPDNYEFYNNDVRITSSSDSTFNTCYRCWHHQGSGEVMVFNNKLTQKAGSGHTGSEALSVLHYRDYAWGLSGSLCCSLDNGLNACDGAQGIDGNRAGNDPLTGLGYHGYPCWHQPGRDVSGNIKPMYAWNNFWADDSSRVPFSVVDFGGGTPPPSCTPQPNGTCNYYSIHVQAAREYYDSVSASAQSNTTTPFNGTTGMGFGTLANRPTTCTTNTAENAFGAGTTGVGYAAGTTVGTIGASSGAGVAGDYLVYKCSATNTWSLYYTPYQYPHPLVSASSGPVFSYAPNPVAFGNVISGTSSSPITVTITNAGNANLVLSTLGAPSDNEYVKGAGCSGVTLTVASPSCTFTVTFTPTSPGSKPATISVPSNAATSPDTITLSGTGLAAGPGVSLSPTSIAFGNQAINTSSAGQTVTLTNTGNTTLTGPAGASLVANIVISPSKYSISSNTCSTTLGAGANCHMTVTFTPTAVGLVSGTLVFTTNAASSPDTVPLTGTGIDPACPANQPIGAYTLCGQAFNHANGASISTSYAPFAGNGIIAWGGWCYDSTCSVAPPTPDVSAIIGDNINATEACFTLSPHSPYDTNLNGLPPGTGDFNQFFIWYCPSVPAGITSFTITPSAAVNFLNIGISEWKAGSLADSCSPISKCWENVDNSASAGNTVGGLSLSIPTSGPTIQANDLVYSVSSHVGAASQAAGYVTVPGAGFTAITFMDPLSKANATEAKAVTSTGVQTATRTWTCTNPPDCTVPWTGAIAVVKGIALNLPSPATNMLIGRVSPQIPLLWTASSTPKVEYSIWRRTAGGIFKKIKSGITGTSWTDNSVVRGQSYTYETQAYFPPPCTQNCNSVMSNQVSINCCP